MMRRYITLTCLLFVFTLNGFSQTKAVTEYGDIVVLYDDGTWVSAPELFIGKEPIQMETPPFKGKILNENKTVSHELKMVSSSPNEITDDERWFEVNDLSLPEYEVPNIFRGIRGNLPDRAPESFKGQMIIRAIYNDEYNFFVYGENFSEGRYLLITDKDVNNALYIMDFESYMLSPDYVVQDLAFIDQSIHWAAIEDGILYISHGHRTYAASSNNMNAYITAIDLASNEIIWRSSPLACNTSNFVLYDDMIVCGYGFTEEPDYLYTLNKKSGAVAQKIVLKSGPNYIIQKENQLFVRTYNTDYIFEIK